MIATSIAYFVTLLLFISGVYGFHQIGKGKINKKIEYQYAMSSLVFILASLALAYAVGI